MIEEFLEIMTEKQLLSLRWYFTFIWLAISDKSYTRVSFPDSADFTYHSALQ